ncbi:hypothetical protein ANN_23690 [Periplaneta americana]|uniref:Uncharacterized protein n=1 Tax=Periplaneta americana TaxID=6978 RepID=A0ABQ8SLT3_PERAM|nr:hypothetical protein ANN_23690 [Periplaneta americana]
MCNRYAVPSHVHHRAAGRDREQCTVFSADTAIVELFFQHIPHWNETSVISWDRKRGAGGCPTLISIPEADFYGTMVQKLIPWVDSNSEGGSLLALASRERDGGHGSVQHCHIVLLEHVQYKYCRREFKLSKDNNDLSLYGKAETITNVLGGFSSTGICPLNSDIFPDHLFRPAAPTDRPQTNAVPTDGPKGATQKSSSTTRNAKEHRMEPSPTTAPAAETSQTRPSALVTQQEISPIPSGMRSVARRKRTHEGSQIEPVAYRQSKYFISQHISTTKHKNALSKATGKKISLLPTVIATSSRKSQFAFYLCKAFLAAEIPLWKVQGCGSSARYTSCITWPVEVVCKLKMGHSSAIYLSMRNPKQPTRVAQAVEARNDSTAWSEGLWVRVPPRAWVLC